MTEIPFGCPINPQCEAEIHIDFPELNDKVAGATVQCETIFCHNNLVPPIVGWGRNQVEAGLNAEFAMREVVKKSCPKWRDLRNVGEVPGDDLPDELMPPFSFS